MGSVVFAVELILHEIRDAMMALHTLTAKPMRHPIDVEHAREDVAFDEKILPELLAGCRAEVTSHYLQEYLVQAVSASELVPTAFPA